MSIVMTIVISFLGWISIIGISTLSAKWHRSDIKKYGEDSFEVYHYESSQKEMLKDGNNLFATALPYIVGMVACYFINNDIVSYIVMIIEIIFVLPSFFQMIVTMIPQIFQFKNKYITVMTLTALINTLIQLMIAINIYFLAIK